MNWTTALQLGRVSNLPTVWTNVVAGAMLVDATPQVCRLGMALVSLSLFYVGGMYLNDGFDRDIDAVERPERPIPAQLVTAPTVFAAGSAMLIAAMVLLVLAAPPAARAAAAGTAALLGAAIVLYDATHKTSVFAPLVMASCRALVYVAAALALGVSVSSSLLEARLWIGALALACYVAGLTYAAAQENLSEIGNLWPLLVLVVALACVAALGVGSVMALVLLGALVAWIANALSFLIARRKRSTGAAVVRLIAGVSLLDAVIVAAAGEPLAALIVASGLPLTRVLQRFVPGT